MIEFKVQIRSKDTLKDYKDTHCAIIVDDFISNPSSWLSLNDTTVSCSWKRTTKVSRGKKK